MLRTARVLCAAGKWDKCFARCLALKAKFASSLVVAEYLDEIDGLLQKSRAAR
jgi:hypothetical protein